MLNKYLIESRLLVIGLMLLLWTPLSLSKELSLAEKIYGLSLIWKEASYNFVYFDQVPALDWDKSYQKALIEVSETKTTYEYYRVLTRFIALLNDGMTRIDMPSGLVKKYIDFPALRLQEVNKQAVVVGIPRSLQQQLPLGSVLLSVDGIKVKDKLKKDVFPYMSTSTKQARWSLGIQGNIERGFGLLAGKPRTLANINFKKPDGTNGSITMLRNLSKTQIEWKLAKGIKSHKEFAFSWLANDIAFIRIDHFKTDSVVNLFRSHLVDLNKAQGLIVDIRKNKGGDTVIAGEIMKHLSFRNLEGAKNKMRVHNSAYKALGRYASTYTWAKDYEPYYTNNSWLVENPDVLDVTSVEKVIIPTAILIGRETAGAAEDFLVFSDSLPHVTTLGEPTFGSTGLPLIVDLPGGGKARICSKRDTFPDGRDFVGSGIKPDTIVYTDVNYYLNKGDLVLDKAHALIGKKIQTLKLPESHKYAAVQTP